MEIPGKRITAVKGMVRGIIVRSPTISQGFMGGLKQFVGAYTEMCEQARAEAHQLMVHWGKLVVVLVALLLLRGCSPDRGSQIRLAPGQRIFGGIAVEEVDGSPFIWGEINGQRYRFLMDTGATGFLLTDHMVMQSGLEYNPSLTMKGHGIGGSVDCMGNCRYAIPNLDGLGRSPWTHQAVVSDVPFRSSPVCRLLP
jgi:hypothetical protein